MDNNDQLTPELIDLLNRIRAYNVTNPEAVFLFAFLGFKKSNEPCKDCGDFCDIIDESKTLLGGHGDLESLRQLDNDLRDMIEDNQEDGFVSF